jgi:hypothetical protein
MYGIKDAIEASADKITDVITRGFFVAASSINRAIPVLGFEEVDSGVFKFLPCCISVNKKWFSVVFSPVCPYFCGQYTVISLGVVGILGLIW